MLDPRDLEKVAAQVTRIRMPVNWDRPLGYDGGARFVIFYWDTGCDDVCITDGINSTTGGAWWLYTNLVENQARSEIAAAMMACGDPVTNDHFPLGDSETEAYCGIILDRFDHELWVARLDDAVPLLCRQHHEATSDPSVIDAALARQKVQLEASQSLSDLKPCDCIRGWVQSGEGYIPCPSCRRAG
jgi:hypothetical protein